MIKASTNLYQNVLTLLSLMLDATDFSVRNRPKSCHRNISSICSVQLSA